ncbi:MAG: prepilin peptidase, partial [Candidatus Eremiobacterota bacterium]
MFLYGSLVGSFLNVCIFRLPKYQPLAVERSHCPHCNILINAYDNIPFISFILLGGKCRSCKKSISPQYFLVEFVTALMFVAFYLKFGLTLLLLKYLVLASLMVIIFFIDLKYQLIFDRLTFSGVISGLIFSLFLNPPGIKDSLLGVAAGYIFFVFIFWFGIILLFFSDFVKEVKLFIKNVFTMPSLPDRKCFYLYIKSFFLWIFKNWDAIGIPVFLTFIIGFSIAVIKLISYGEDMFSLPIASIFFLIFFLLLLIVFLIHIIKDIYREEIYSEYLRLSNQKEPVFFCAVSGLLSFISASVFREEDEELPPIGGGDAKFGALIGAFIGWQ